MGAGSDLSIYHDTANSRIVSSTGWLRYQSLIGYQWYNSDTSETIIEANVNVPVELYYDNVNTFKTTGNGINILGPEGGAVQLDFNADAGDDNNDKWKVYIPDGGGDFYIQSKSSGSWVSGLTIASGGGSVTATKFLGDGSALTGVGGDTDITSCLFV